MMSPSTAMYRAAPARVPAGRSVSRVDAVGEEPSVREVTIEGAYRVGDVVARDSSAADIPDRLRMAPGDVARHADQRERGTWYRAAHACRLPASVDCVLVTAAGGGWDLERGPDALARPGLVGRLPHWDPVIMSTSANGQVLTGTWTEEPAPPTTTRAPSTTARSSSCSSQPGGR